MKKQEELGHTALLVAIDGKNERKKKSLKILTRILNFLLDHIAYCLLKRHYWGRCEAHSSKIRGLSLEKL